MTNCRTRRMLTVILLAGLTWPVSGRQERGPNGAIYNELQPFVGLDGVRFEIMGLGGAMINVPGVVGDPETVVTGLSRAQREELDRAVRGDVADALRAARIPMLESGPTPEETRPVISIRVSWQRPKPDSISVQVEIRLLEAGHLLKDPKTVVWTPTWGSTFYTIASGPDLASVIRSTARAQVDTFVRLYIRAHAKLANLSLQPTARVSSF